jgi:LAS superfamily LD-carboxypeptidase LdcB
LQRLARLAGDYGDTVNISSGRRSTEEQQSIWDSTPEEDRGIMVARPGTSRHESGNAADIDSDWFQGISNDILAKYGLKKPMDYESWHVEIG